MRRPALIALLLLAGCSHEPVTQITLKKSAMMWKDAAVVDGVKLDGAQLIGDYQRLMSKSTTIEEGLRFYSDHTVLFVADDIFKVLEPPRSIGGQDFYHVEVVRGRNIFKHSLAGERGYLEAEDLK